MRYFLFPENGEPVRLSQRLVQGMADGSDALPQFAGTSQKILCLILDLEDGKPVGIVRHDASIWAFDESGTITDSLRKSFAEILDFAFPPSETGNVVALNPKIKKRRHDELHRWKPSKDEISRAAADVWRTPGVKALRPAKGVNRRPPPLTYEARHALEEASSHFFNIEHQLWHLKEPALKGLAFEARKRASQAERAELYRAVAEMAESRLRLISRRKSAKGVWYALVEIYQIEQHGIESVVATYHRKCNGREAAEAAGRELLMAHAKSISADRSVQVSIETDLEWDAADRWSNES